MSEDRRNWPGNLTYGAARVHLPETVAEVQELVAAAERVKAVGARHSFSAVADTTGDLLASDRLNRVVASDPARRTVTVEAGMRYGHLGLALHQAGFALHNLASLPTITVGGACATATHGSGDANGNLATAVAALELVTADGSVVTLSREADGERFLGAVVGIGGLGVVTRLTLDIVPTFQVRQHVYEGLTIEQLDANFDAVMASAYSVSLFTDWRDRRFLVWVKRLGADGDGDERDLFGATLATGQRHPVAGNTGEDWTEQGGILGPWHERLTHFRLETMATSGAELQSEYFVPRRHARAALRAIDALRERIAPLLMAAEVRTIAADNLWMSTCYHQDSVAYHFTWVPDWPAVRALLPLIEERLDPFDARPHWGKLFTTSPARLRALYPKLPDFRALLREFDPGGKFRNAFLDEYILAEG